jgi:type I restriction enzyme S subunit
MSDWNNIFNANIRTYVQIISAWLISEMEWEEIDVEKALAKKNFIIKESVLQKDYKKLGLYPIVSQSKDLISGYSNEKDLLIDQDIPTVIFGDHTQVIKYIDFPFIIGADGVKILKPLDEYIPKFFYYLIKSIDLNSSKYARHYKILRSQKIPYKDKSFDVQEKIVAFLDDLQINALKEKIYFDYSIESKILELHRFILNINNVIHENQKQEKYVSQLKQAILQEAIAGQLTAEWRTENPMQKGNPDTDAAALLAKIKAEKQRLIAEGKLKKEKPLAEIAIDEVPFSIPDSWVWCRLGDIIKESPKNGYSPKAVSHPTNIKTLKLGATTSGKFNPDECKYIDEYITPDSFLWLKKNDILIQRSNSLDYVGVSAIYDGEDNQFIYPDLMMKIQMMQNVSIEFSSLLLSSPMTREYYRSLAKGAQKSMPKINQGVVLNTLFPLPPLAEQKAIFEKVDKLMNIIDRLEQQIKHRKQLAENLMQTVLREAFE